MMTRMVEGKWVNGFADLLWKSAARQLTGGLVHARRLATFQIQIQLTYLAYGVY